MKNERIIRTITAFAVAVSLLIPAMPQPVSAASIPGVADWSVTYNNGVQGTVSLDTTTKASGKQSLKITNQSALANNVYILLSTSVNVEKGKKYQYGMRAKAAAAANCYAMISWGTRNSMLPLGTNMDWTNLQFEYIHTGNTGTVTLMVLNDQITGGLWVDDFFFYEYDGRKRIGENRVKNPGFEGGSATGGDSAAYDRAHSAGKFKKEDFEKAMSTFRYLPAYKNEAISPDGSLDEWADYAEVRLPLTEDHKQNYASGEYDNEAYFKFAYDEEYLYFAAEVTDDEFYSVDGSTYWQGDSVQLTLGGLADTYGTELGFYRSMSGESKAHSSSLAAERVALIRFGTARKGNKTIYEGAIPWTLHFSGFPGERVLVGALINDNDNGARENCLQIAPGIAEGKRNAKFPELALLESPKQSYGWLEGERGIKSNTDCGYDFYYVNNGAAGDFTISAPDGGLEKTVSLASGEGIRESFFVNIPEDGVRELGVTVRGSDGREEAYAFRVTVSEYIKLDPSEVEVLTLYANELKGLLDQCKAKGISTDYEMITYKIIERFQTYTAEDIAKDNGVRARYQLSVMKQMYEKARESLAGYLSGKAQPFAVPRYVTGDLELSGTSVIGDTHTGRDFARRPVFLIGFGHFSNARKDVPVFNQFGFNMIQTEIGINSVVREVTDAPKWLKTVSASGSFAVSTEEKHGGEQSFKIVNNTAYGPNKYFMLSQAVTVKPNTAYKWGFFAKAVNSKVLYTSAHGYDNRKYQPDGSHDWKEISYEYTTGPYETSLNFSIVSEDSTTALYIDDVYLREAGSERNVIENPGFEEKPDSDADFITDTKSVSQITSVLANAEQNNVAVSLLISPHYFPGFLLKQDETLADPKGGFIKFHIYHPKAMAAMEAYIRALIPLVKDYKSLHDICLTNESVYYSNNSDINLPAFRAYLREAYEGDLGRLNTAYQSAYTDFDEVPMPAAIESSARYYDWMTFNNVYFADWHKWVADMIREIAPDIPLHAKMMANNATRDNTYGGRSFMSHGTDAELFAGFSDISGNDSHYYYRGNEPEDTRIGLNALGKFQWYDIQSSFKDAPVIDSEDHIIEDRNTVYTPEQALHVETSTWNGAVHGRSVSAAWVWERSYDPNSDFYTGILNRPDCIEAVGRAALDLNRLAYEVTALQQEKREAAIYFSNATRVYSTSYMNLMYYAHEALAYGGERSFYFTDSSAERIHDYPLVVLPGITNLPKSALTEIEKYARNGGQLLIFGRDSLVRDEHNLPHDPAVVSSIMSHAEVVDTTSDGYSHVSPAKQELRKIVNAVLEKNKIGRVKLIDVETGEAVTVTEWIDAEYDGKTIVNICNYEWKRPVTVKVVVDGREAVRMSELRRGTRLENTVALQPYEPVLIRVEE